MQQPTVRPSTRRYRNRQNTYQNSSSHFFSNKNNNMTVPRSASRSLPMMKILIGLATAIVVAVGGFFGFQFYTQHRIAGQVDAAFEQIRAAGGKASHGKVSFDLVNRTLDIADVVAETSTQPP